MGLSELLVNGRAWQFWASTSPRRAACVRAIAGKTRIRRRLTLPEFKERAVRMRVRKDPTRWVFEISDDGEASTGASSTSIRSAPLRPTGAVSPCHASCRFSSLTYIPPGNRVVVTVPREQTPE